MKLYEVPRNSYVKLLTDEASPPAALPNNDGDVVKFIRIDGMYSYCLDLAGAVRHLPAWLEVVVVENF